MVRILVLEMPCVLLARQRADDHHEEGCGE
jgi:hypothetical protein